MKTFIYLTVPTIDELEWVRENFGEVKVKIKSETIHSFNSSRQYVGKVTYSFDATTTEHETLLVLKYGSLDNFMYIGYNE